MSKAAAMIDQVLRKQRFIRDHPDVGINHLTAPSWHWRARWTGADGQAHERANFDLGLLLDELEPALGELCGLVPARRVDRGRASAANMRLSKTVRHRRGHPYVADRGLVRLRLCADR